jgi:hypothetical protein
MIEAMYDGDSSLPQKLLDYDECGNKGFESCIYQKTQIRNAIFSDGGDECDRMSKVYKCGAEKDPALISNMMTVADVSTPLELNPLPSSSAVCPEFKCNVDVSFFAFTDFKLLKMFLSQMKAMINFQKKGLLPFFEKSLFWNQCLQWRQSLGQQFTKRAAENIFSTIEYHNTFKFLKQCNVFQSERLSVKHIEDLLQHGAAKGDDHLERGRKVLGLGTQRLQVANVKIRFDWLTQKRSGQNNYVSVALSRIGGSSPRHCASSSSVPFDPSQYTWETPYANYDPDVGNVVARPGGGGTFLTFKITAQGYAVVVCQD